MKLEAVIFVALRQIRKWKIGMSFHNFMLEARAMKTECSTKLDSQLDYGAVFSEKLLWLKVVVDLDRQDTVQNT